MLKRVLLLCVCVIVVPGVSPAQGLPTGYSSVFSSYPISLSASVGWLSHPSGMSLTTRLINFNQEFVDENPLRGAWLELTAQCSVSDRVGLLISGGMLAPSESGGAEQQTVAGTAAEYSLSGTSWGSIQGLVSYGLSDSFQVIGGFRWDHFNTRVDFSRSPAFLDFKLNTYVPLIGVQLDQRFFDGALITRIMGWPGTLPGHMTQSYVGGPQTQGKDRIEQDPGRGYLIEFCTEYRKTLFGSASAGVLLRWNTLHVAADEGRYDWRTNRTIGTGLATESFDRQSLTIAGSLTVDFTLPGFL